MVNSSLQMVSTKLLRSTLFWWLSLIFIPAVGWAQSPDKLEWWGDQYMEEGNYPLAEGYYREAYLLDSSSFELGFKYGRSAWHNRNDPRAFQLFERTIKKDQGKLRPEAYFYLGNLSMRNGQYPQAIQYWKKYKQKIKKDKGFHPESTLVDFGIRSAEWAMQQVNVDSIHWKLAGINSVQSEGQAYWIEDSVHYQYWDSTQWFGKIADSSLTTSVLSKEQYLGYPVLHVIPFANRKIGVGQLAENDVQLIEKDGPGDWMPIEKLYFRGTRNTMPTIAHWEGHDYLLFCSNRKGGEGGMDIWMSRWQDGQWAAPRPMDNSINTPLDEIEPGWHKGQLYFTSKGHLGFGEFDIFCAKGSPDNWTSVSNMGLPINSSQNDIGLSIREDSLGQKWIWSSSRQGTGCCLDIYQYEWKAKQIQPLDSMPRDIAWLEMWLPLPLYFHNDEPQPKSMDTTTQWTYADCYLSYLKKGTEYQMALQDENEWDQFEETQLKLRNDQWQRAMQIIESRLLNGDTMILIVRGFASPLAAGDYNLNLTQRRIAALKNDLSAWNNGSLQPFFGKQLQIKAMPFGESKSARVSDDRTNTKESIYSRNAREERRIEIEGVEWRSSKGQLKRLGKAQ
jgi:hypothetical protein